MEYSKLPMILTPSDVQKILNCKKEQVYNLFRSKSFPSERINGKHIIPKPLFSIGLEETSGELLEKVSVWPVTSLRNFLRIPTLEKVVDDTDSL